MMVKTVTNNIPNFSMLLSPFNVTPHFSRVTMINVSVIPTAIVSTPASRYILSPGGICMLFMLSMVIIPTLFIIPTMIIPRIQLILLYRGFTHM